jgi:hypothetical protein
MADVQPNAEVVTRTLSLQTLRAYWTSVVAVLDKVLFYDNRTGDAAIGEIQGYSLLVPSFRVGTLTMKRDLPRAFFPWMEHRESHVVRVPNVPTEMTRNHMIAGQVI